MPLGSEPPGNLIKNREDSWALPQEPLKTWQSNSAQREIAQRKSKVAEGKCQIQPQTWTFQPAHSTGLFPREEGWRKVPGQVSRLRSTGPEATRATCWVFQSLLLTLGPDDSTCGVCPVQHSKFSSIPHLCSSPVSQIGATNLEQHVSRYCQITPEGQNHPSLRTTELGEWFKFLVWSFVLLAPAWDRIRRLPHWATQAPWEGPTCYRAFP